VGESDHCANRIQEYANAGIDHFFLAFQDPFDTKSPRSFADVIDILIIIFSKKIEIAQYYLKAT
jgi:hypothetical protein